MSEFQRAARQQTSMPPWINSDHLTAIGFLAMVAAGFAYRYSAIDRTVGLLLVIVFLILNWFGDSPTGCRA